MNLTITETSEYIDLVAKANRYTKLYDLGKPEISDKQWDDIYFAIADFEVLFLAALLHKIFLLLL